MNQEKFLTEKIEMNIRKKKGAFPLGLPKNVHFCTGGVLLACLCMTPFLLLGTGSIITYHDQLDGELLGYLLSARYLFTGIHVYPEIMNGLPVAGAVPPAPLFVLLYSFFKPFTAFLLAQWIIYLVSFIGMYLLLMKLTKKKLLSFGIAVIFMLLPFYPVYGLCIPGQPLLILAVLSLSSEEALSSRALFGRKSFACYLLLVLYGVSSSPVLVGFACLLALGIFALLQTFSSLRHRKKVLRSPWIALALLLIAYLVANPDLILQVLSPETAYVSHRTEMVSSPSDFFGSLKEVFMADVSYAQSYHGVLFFLMAVCALIFLSVFFRHRGSLFPVPSRIPVSRRTGQELSVCIDLTPLYKAAGVLSVIFIICLFYAFYSSAFMTELRNASGGLLKTFNLMRVCWLLPTAWCILAGYLLDFLTGLREGKEMPDTSGKSVTQWNLCLKYGAILTVCGIWGGAVLLHSPLRPNLSKVIKAMMLGKEYYALDWKSFFAEDIFSQIDAAVGRPKESYHVVSIGIYPAVALYNGFYCLDGYSNNYPLTYKQTFRRIIEGELNKNEYLRVLFDTWGNRCYITTAEQNNYYTFEKKWNSVIYDLDLNMKQLKELDCQYIFSAAYLLNAEEKGLSLLREAPFETEDSWYHIYVYKIE